MDGNPAPGLRVESLSAVVPSAEVGGTQGVAAVSNTGAAQYTLQVPTAPGPAGFTPTITVSYDSNHGNGILGVGWRINVGSRISRCASRPAIHGFHRGVEFDGDDALCLDGQPLVREGDRWYPESGLEEIRLVGDLADPDSYFAVRLPNGGRRYYGGRDARYHPGRLIRGSDGEPTDGPRTTYSWLLAEERDSSGNFIQYHWSSDLGGEEPVLMAIRWGDRVGIDAPPRSRDLGWDARGVEFHYEPRADPIVSFYRGIRTTLSQRLDRIESLGPAWSAERRVRELDFVYEYSAATERSLIVAIEERDHFGRKLPRVEFEYTSETAAVPEFEPNAIGNRGSNWWNYWSSRDDGIAFVAAAPAFVVPADVNGDGFDDLLYWDAISGGGYGWHLRLGSRGGGFSAVMASGLPNLTNTVYPALDVADLDRDGDDEIIYARKTSTAPGAEIVWDVYDWDGTQLVREIQDFAGCSHDSTIGIPLATLVGDFDGNGGMDVVHGCARDVTWDSGHLTPGAFAWTAAWQDGQAWWSWNEQAVMGMTSGGASAAPYTDWAAVRDFDGDGRDDLLFWPNVDDQWWAVSIDQSAAPDIVPVNLSGGSNIRYVFLDANGDGLSDALEFDNSGAESYVALRVNTGEGFGAPLVLEAADPAYADLYVTRSRTLPTGVVVTVKPSPSQVRVFDWNADGRQDFLWLQEGNTPEDGRVILHTATTMPDGTPTFRLDLLPIDPGTWEPVRGFLATILLDGAHLLVAERDDTLTVHHQWVEVPPDLLYRVKGDHEVDTIFLYEAGPSATERATDCEFPQACRRPGTPVVRDAYLPTNGGEYPISKRYVGSRTDVGGRGWLGFDRVETEFSCWFTRPICTDNDGMTTIARYEHRDRVPTALSGSTYTYRSVDTPVEVQTEIRERVGFVYPPDGPARVSVARVQEEVHFLSADRRRWVRRPDRATLDDYEFDSWTGTLSSAGLLRARETTYTWDSFGFLESEVTVVPGAEASRVSFAPREHRTADWILGLPTNIELGSTLEPGTAEGVRVLSQEFDGRGRLRTRTTHGAGAEWSKTTWHYTTSGNVREIVMEGREPEDVDETSWSDLWRVTTLEYDDDDVFVESIDNGAGSTSYTYHESLGVLTSVSDPSGYVTYWVYDGFGRPVREKHDDGGWEVSYGPSPDAWIRTELKTADGRETTLDVDSWGRTRRRRTLRFDRWSVETARYDAWGRLSGQDLPHWEEATTIPEVRYTYDNLGRVTRIDNDGRITEYEYEGLSVLTTDPNGISRLVEVDGLGRVRRTDEGHEGVEARYSYAPFGLLSRVVSESDDELALVVWEAEYDAWGRRVRLSDPDSGVLESVYNSFGEMRGARNAVGEELLIMRDHAGREYERWTSTGGLTTFEWDDDGRLERACTDGQQVCSDYAYYPSGLVRSQTQTSAFGSYTIGYEYGKNGQLERLVYPEAWSHDPFAVDYKYEEGSLREVWTVDPRWNTRLQLLWRAEELDPRGSAATETLADGNIRTLRERNAATGQVEYAYAERVVGPSAPERIQEITFGYYANGNLQQRSNAVTGLDEHFTYDKRNRIDHWSINGTLKTDYDHDDRGNLTRIGSRVQSFGPTGGSGFVGPHAVRASGSETFHYDAAGRQIVRGSQQIEYEWSGLPRSISSGGVIETSFQYDAWGTRVGRVAANGEWTTYVGDLFELRDDGAFAVFHVFAAGREIAQVTYDKSNGVASTHYPLTDHQGTVEAVADDGGTIGGRYLFTPFGSPLVASGPSAIRHPWVGHEQDDSGLTNMRGRMYDPKTGRFLTPDPVSLTPAVGQSLNAYSYVLGNPATLTDPTGLWFSFPGGGGSAPDPFGYPDPTGGTTGTAGAGIGPGSSFGEVARPVTDSGGAATPGEAAAAFVSGALIGAGTSLAAAYGTGLAIGLLCGPGAPVCSGVAMAAITVAALGYGAYQAYSHWDAVSGWGDRMFVSGGATADDWSILGTVVGGGVATPGAAAALRTGRLHGVAAHIARPAAMGGNVAHGGLALHGPEIRAITRVQEIVNQRNAQMGSDPTMVASMLSREEAAAITSPGQARMAWGNALERIVARDIAADPELSHYFVHNRGAGPDFYGRGPLSGEIFDITTFASEAAHAARPYGGQLRMWLYERPPGAI